MSIAVAIGLILEALSILIQWLEHRRQKNRPLTGRQKRVLGHVLARVEAFRTAADKFGCTPLDDAAGDAVVKADAVGFDAEDAP